ncbi:sigma-70 family RNA polymerase sigma factor [Leptospira langatensis]|uniref:Sigma-70 family RNA polymerase sigma factor n=1 Tax=Leptospira langatensis TaxID=2484983 RepID=A0A5F1ZSZ0_9LEPT|nr:sigma-70 family RNA polymerase sigma factor [Leptospira langatensis]TGK00196.1 sigma-70 family RNA polymerase sigma factor [Leptospira langatensis]TGL41174.1 sigma-70 family RNA polymerase sigma factor [Leptospira langatensis]
MTNQEKLDQFIEHKGIVFGIAYRMTGSVTEAEDIVQESFLRWEKAKEISIKSPKAFLSTIAARLSLDSLRKAKRKRETYIGPWLPEPMAPVSSEEEPDSETLDLAFLHILEKLNPIERAVFLLRETFEMEYDSISEVVGKSVENCRQILKRAKEALKTSRRRYEANPETRKKIFRDFLLAASKGKPELLVPFLKEEIVIWSDGGGKVNAARIPIYGQERVSHFLNKVRANPLRHQLDFYYTFVNGAESLIGYNGNEPVYFQNFLIEEEGIWKIMNVLNPDKLNSFQNKQELLDKELIFPIENFLLFPNSYHKGVPKWLNPVVQLVKWVVSR